MRKPKLNQEEKEKKLEALKALRSHWGWGALEEMVRYMQGMETATLFTSKFVGLSPEQQSKEHYAVVRVNQVLERLLVLPQWLERHNPSKWNEVVEYITKGEATNG